MIIAPSVQYLYLMYPAVEFDKLAKRFNKALNKYVVIWNHGTLGAKITLSVFHWKNYLEIYFPFFFWFLHFTFLQAVGEQNNLTFSARCPLVDP